MARTVARSGITTSLGAGMIALAAVAGPASPAQAINWYAKDCSTFAGCNAVGLGNAGYEKEYTQSHWGMYGGHNCTNYAAYRVMKQGIDASYLQGQGMAYQWGTVAAGHGVSVDKNPKVGDIAWFSATAGMSSSGHVAYVEAVDLAKGRVRVSEDNWSGDFDWRYYNIADVTGFIHFSGAPTTTPPGAVTPGAGASPSSTSLVATLKVPDVVTAQTATLSWSGAPAYGVQRRSVSVSTTGVRTFSTPTDWFTNTTTTAASFTGVAGGVYQFRVRAIDSTGAVGSWGGWQTVTMPIDDRSATMSGTWTSGTSSAYYANTFRYTTMSAAALTFTGWTDQITVIGAKAKGTGRFSVYVDGVNKGTFDTFRATTAYRQVLANLPVAYGKHTVKLVNQGTAGRPYLYVDAVALRR